MQRTIQVAYWDGQKKYFTAAKGRLEGLLKGLGDVALTAITHLEQVEINKTDLVLTTADHVDEEDFIKWLDGLAKRFKKNHLIWVPAIILADLPQYLMEELLPKGVASNWYFDVVAPSSLDSLPLRMANMIRIHDHLKELNRYDRELQSLSTRLGEVEKKLQQT